MSNDDALQGISADIAAGRKDGLSDRILAVAQSTEDPFDILKLMSLLKLLPHDSVESKVAEIVVSKADSSNGLSLANGLYNLGCHVQASDILRKLEPSDQVERLRCKCLCDMEEYEYALEVYNLIKEPVINDKVLKCRLLSAVGEHKKAIAASEELLSEFPKDYDVRVTYARALMMGGHNKEALKYAREGLKEKTADANAVAAYVLWVQGNIKAAGGYASRAVQMDNTHIGAMGVLGICLALKGEYEKAKITAGAINELSPGNRIAIEVLSYCEGH